MADLAESIMKNLRRVHPISTMIKVGLCSSRLYLNAFVSCFFKKKPLLWSSPGVANPSRNHEVLGLIPGFA